VKIQADCLTSRLEDRRKLRSLKEKKNSISQFDKSAGLSPVEVFEAEMEEIVERYAEIKAKVKRDVEESYQECLSEIQGSGDLVLVRLVEQMRKNMKGEIEVKVQEIEAKKVLEIAKAREKLARLS
jgi:hypothetical protein